MDIQSIDPLWSNSLKPGIEKLLSGFYSEPNFEELYRAAYTLVLHGHGQKLYEKTRELIIEYLVEKVRPKLAGSPSTEFLVTLKQIWNDYERSMVMIRCILMYMDRHYVSGQRLEPVYDLGLRLFRENIILFSTTRQYFINALLEMMARERHGEIIDRTIIKDISLKLTKLNINETSFYNEDFQTLCLQYLSEFYQSESKKLLSENAPSEYIKKIDLFINEETERIIFYFDQSIEKRFRQLVLDEFIIKHKEHLMKMEKSRIHQILEMDQYEELEMIYRLYQRIPNGLLIIADCISEYLREHDQTLLITNEIQNKNFISFLENFIDLKGKFDKFVVKAFDFDSIITQQIDSDFEHLMNLNEHSQEHLLTFIDDHLKDKQSLNDLQIVTLIKAVLLLRYVKDKDLLLRYYNYMKEKSVLDEMFQSDQYEILAIVYKDCQQIPDCLSIVVDSMSNNLRKRGGTLLTGNVTLFIENLMKLKDTFDQFLIKSFHSNNIFVQQMNSDWEYIINLNEHNPKYFSLFINNQLKKSNQNRDHQQIEGILNKLIKLIGYLKEQDTFKEYYEKHLAKRLLSNQSASKDLENYVLLLFINNFGNEFTSKVKCMLKDVSLSDTLNKDFQSYVNQNGLNLYDIDFVVRVLKTDFWPISSINNQCNLPTIVRKTYDCFQDFYLNKHNGRRLTLLSQLGSADLETVFYEKSTNKERKYILQVSTYQMVILMLFNTKDYWSFEEILHETDINEDDLKRALISLIS
ncbi:unnamed protein product [Adineta steineri]|uniref:Cullin family profile domain-containing protein n=1 Tax=Adineta steineri TaxID=433720 RepID=A0A815GC14_9BILA|nr:unnamed protein product [Adineta steineri]CAF1336746.1 unnamed protein product [Adineta steineri]CAF1440969.1 unnamed protein product [Adineta steineri]